MKPLKPVSVISLLMAFLVLTSSVGVTQVSHICQLALAGMEKQSCKTESSDDHACCSNEAENESGETDDPCCTNEIKVFSQEVISTPPATGKTLAMEATEISLIAFPLSLIEEFVECKGLISPLLSASFPEPDILIQKCTLLI